MGGLSVCCMSGGYSPTRLASILALFANVADEIVVAIEEPRAIATYDAVGLVADRVVSFPPAEPADRPIPWLFGLCSGSWILNIDDDEVPSPALLATLPEIVARRDITHAWIARRWLYPTTDTYLAEPPWSTESQLRLFLADERFLQFSDVFHRPVVAHGPGLFIDAPLWHLDTAVNPVERRQAKATAYEFARPGMSISGRCHNQALYVPESVANVALAVVPCADHAVIDAVVEGGLTTTRKSRASLAYASAGDIDLAWPGPPYPDTLQQGRIAVAALPVSMRAGVQETIDAHITNESTETWRWGKDARPEIRLGYRWSLDGQHVHEPIGLRTPLPADLRSGETCFVPVHVVPPSQPGRYELQLDVLHEGFGCFGSTAAVALDVRERQLVAILGRPAAVTRTLVRLSLLPEVEPVVVLGNDSDRPAFGDYRSVPGLRQPLLFGLERSGRLSRGLRLSWRSIGLVRSARRYRRTEITHDVRLTGVFDVLAHSQALIVAGTDWPDDAAAGREWWRLMTTMLLARTMNVPAFVSAETAPDGTGTRHALVRFLVARLSSPLEDGLDPSHLPARAGTPVLCGDSTDENVAEARDSVSALR